MSILSFSDLPETLTMQTFEYWTGIINNIVLSIGTLNNVANDLFYKTLKRIADSIGDLVFDSTNFMCNFKLLLLNVHI